MKAINHSEKILSFLFSQYESGTFKYEFDIPDNLILTSVSITKVVSNSERLNICLLYNNKCAFKFDSSFVKKGIRFCDIPVYEDEQGSDIMNKNLGRSISILVECSENSQFFLYAQLAKINPLGNFSDVITL